MGHTPTPGGFLSSSFDRRESFNVAGSENRLEHPLRYGTYVTFIIPALLPFPFQRLIFSHWSYFMAVV